MSPLLLNWIFIFFELSLTLAIPFQEMITKENDQNLLRIVIVLVRDLSTFLINFRDRARYTEIMKKHKQNLQESWRAENVQRRKVCSYSVSGNILSKIKKSKNHSTKLYVVFYA